MENVLGILHTASEDLQNAVKALEPIFIHEGIPQHVVNSTAVCVNAMIRVSQRHLTIETLLRQVSLPPNLDEPDATCIEARGESPELQAIQNEETPSGDITPMDGLQEMAIQTEDMAPHRQFAESIDAPSQRQTRKRPTKKPGIPPVSLSPERLRNTILSRGIHCLRQNTLKLIEYTRRKHGSKSTAEIQSEKTGELVAFWDIHRNTTNRDDRSQREETFLYWAYCIVFHRRIMDWVGGKKHLSKADWEKLLRRLELPENFMEDWYEDKRLKRYRLSGRRLLNYSMVDESQAGDEGPLKGLSACIPTQQDRAGDCTLRELQETNDETLSSTKSGFERALLFGPQSNHIKRLLEWGAAIMDILEEGKNFSLDPKVMLLHRVPWLHVDDLKFLDGPTPASTDTTRQTAPESDQIIVLD